MELFERGLAGEFDAPPNERLDVEQRNVNAIDGHGVLSEDQAGGLNI
jgi:hypothetical protein